MVNKKIAILTLYSSSSGNYGQILQGYSTYYYLKRKGYNPCIMNYIDATYSEECKFIQEYNNICVRRVFFRCREEAYALLYPRVAKLREFIDNNVNLSIPCFSEEQVINQIKDGNYGTLIVGSDTCWYGGSSDVFSLRFADDKYVKISYAASCLAVKKDYRNSHLWLNISDGIRNMDYISVREKTLVSNVRYFCNREAQLVLDPVFLLDRNHWKRMARSRIRKKPYILFYMMGDIECHRGWFERIKKKYGNCDVVLVRKMEERAQFLKGAIIEDKLSVEDFLNYIEFADVVISDSFHGIAFSIIYEKNFYSVMRNDSRDSYGRIKNLLEIFGLENRLLHEKCTDERIDYNLVNNTYNKWVMKTRSFLDNACEDAEE